MHRIQHLNQRFEDFSTAFNERYFLLGCRVIACSAGVIAIISRIRP
jgi:hypothetical protein